MHHFLECPDVAGASDWLVWLWVAVFPPGSTAPPRSAAVLLADDDHVWQPDISEEHRQLWIILRLSFLQAVWCLRCRRLIGQTKWPSASDQTTASALQTYVWPPAPPSSPKCTRTAPDERGQAEHSGAVPH